jgi:PII-like signaling protein
MAHAERRRARFFSRNDGVPLLVVSVGPAAAIADVLPELGRVLERPIATLEWIRVCKRGGHRHGEPRHLPLQDDSGLGIWQQLTVYASEQTRHGGHTLHLQLIRRLREAGANGATTVQGIWGFSGDHPPHGDRLFRLRRHVPVVTTVVDTPERIRRWFELVDELTDEGGLVTSELVPAVQAVAPGRRTGGLRLARWRPPAVRGRHR